MPTQEQLNKLLFEAIESDNLDQARDLVEQGADVNVHLKHAIYRARRRDYSYSYAGNPVMDIVRLLITNGAEIKQEEILEEIFGKHEEQKQSFKNDLGKIVDKSLASFLNNDEKTRANNYVEHVFEKSNGKRVNVSNLREIGDKKITIISTEPGMGKTNALTHLARQANVQGVQTLIVNLGNLEKGLFDIRSDNINPGNAINFLLAGNGRLSNIISQKSGYYYNSKSRLMKLLLTSIVRPYLIEKYIAENERVVIVLDGFDEISPECEKNAINLVRALNSLENVEKILITTRPHIQSKLEEEFCVSSYRLRPFSKKDQMEFYKKFCDNSQIDYDTMNRLLNSFFNSIKDPSWEFGKIPLHAQMIAEALSGGKLVNNLSSLYKRFVEEKYKVYYEEKCGSNLSNVAVKCSMKRSTESYAESYSNLALNELFDEDKIKPFINKDAIKLDSALKQGFIRIVDGKVSFIHRTFAEYAATDLFFRAIKFQKDDMKKYKLVCDFLHKHIFKADSEVFCKFLDYKLAESREIHTLVLNNDVSKVHDFLSKEGGSVIDSVDLLGRTPLHLAAFYSCKEAVKLLLEKGAKLDIKDKFGLTPLKYAEKNGDKDIIDLLKVAQKVATLTGSDSTNTTSKEADARMQTGNNEKLHTEATANPTMPSGNNQNEAQSKSPQQNHNLPPTDQLSTIPNKSPQQTSTKKRFMYGMMIASPFLAVGIYSGLAGAVAFNPILATGIFIGVAVAALASFVIMKASEEKEKDPDISTWNAVKTVLKNIFTFQCERDDGIKV